MRVQLVSFDLDGTLVDSAAEIARAANDSLAEHGIAPRSIGEIRDLIGGGTRELMLTLLALSFAAQPALADRVRPEAALASMERHYALASARKAPVYPGAREALLRLKQDGVRLACTTNKALAHTLRVLQATELDVYFDLVIGGDSLPVRKPHPGVLRHVAAALGVPLAQCAHVGDSATDVECARAAAVAAWAVPYGYNRGAPIEQARPQRLFDNLLAMAKHVIDGNAAAAASGATEKQGTRWAA